MYVIHVMYVCMYLCMYVCNVCMYGMCVCRSCMFCIVCAHVMCVCIVGMYGTYVFVLRVASILLRLNAMLRYACMV